MLDIKIILFYIVIYLLTSNSNSNSIICIVYSHICHVCYSIPKKSESHETILKITLFNISFDSYNGR